MQALSDTEVQRVVELLAASGLVSTWLITHAAEVLRVAPGGAGTDALERPLEVFGADQVETFSDFGMRRGQCMAVDGSSRNVLKTRF